MTIRSLDLHRRARSVVAAIVLWAFGLSTTVLLVGMWGRAVSGDSSTLEASAEAAVEAEIATERVVEWVAEGIAGATDRADRSQVTTALDLVATAPQTRDAIAAVIEQVMAAALAPPGTTVEIDLGDTLLPMVPLITNGLQQQGIEVTADEVVGAVQALEPVVLDTEDVGGLATVARDAKSLLTVVLVVGLGMMLLTGGISVWLAVERARMLRSLAIRVMVSAFTFSLMLRLGAWALDPDGGRSPLARSSAVLLGSHHPLLWAMVLGAGFVALLAGVFVVRRRRSGAGQPGVASVEHRIETDMELTPHR